MPRGAQNEYFPNNSFLKCPSANMVITKIIKEDTHAARKIQGIFYFFAILDYLLLGSILVFMDMIGATSLMFV